jgi:hypothetical protein
MPLFKKNFGLGKKSNIFATFQKKLWVSMGSLKRKFGTSSCFKKNMRKKVQPPQKAAKKIFFHENVPPHPCQKMY